ncbi:MAG TPA: glycosyltransferase family 39 protein [Pyrinomonadaceae bacterium]|nr:glycosyltransferase family 39 protein [Pyrinomonadaceae bacterium]
MTPPPRKADADAAAPHRAPDAPLPAPSTRKRTSASRTTRHLRTPLVFLLIFAVVLLLHLTLLELPYYLDEAGYFIPAARDIYTDGQFVPHSTLSNAHPPLVMAYLALAWSLFGFRVVVTRTAMLLVSALALTGLFRLAERVSNARVAAATVLCTALYPVFFAQSSLAHLDLTAAALTLWGLVLYLPPRHDEVGAPDEAVGAGLVPARVDSSARVDSTDATSREEDGQGQALPLQNQRGLQNSSAALYSGDSGVLESRSGRRALCVAVFALAALAKETALLVPFVLCAWELLCRLARKRERLAATVCVERPRAVLWSLALLLACAPLALWFAYHRARTGYTFGNPDYFRYNVASTLSLARVLTAGWERLKHVTYHMNLWALTLAGLAAMFLRPRRDGNVERTRIAPPVQLLFAVLILAHVFALSLVGGAVLARYMLPVLPLVLLVWVSTIRRRVPLWPLAVALVCAAFVYRTEVNPPYSFPWEDNLAYRDFVLLHRDAAHFLDAHSPGARVLTAWPATDELKNPDFGYLERPVRVVPAADFKYETLMQAARQKSDYDAALLFSTHGGLGLEEARQLLGGRVIFQEERKGQWVAVVEVSSKQ